MLLLGGTDPGGSVGQASASVAVTAAPAEFTVVAGADAFVSSSAPASGCGGRGVDADGHVQHMDVRFDVTGLGGGAAAGSLLAEVGVVDLVLTPPVGHRAAAGLPGDDGASRAGRDAMTAVTRWDDESMGRASPLTLGETACYHSP